MSENKVPTLLVVVILIFGISAGVFLVQKNQDFRLGAQGDSKPENIITTNETDSSFTTSWTTNKKAACFLSWGESEPDLTNTESDEIGELGNIHSVTVQGVDPQTNYLFKINCDGDYYDNNGVPWVATTGAKIDLPEKQMQISGNIVTSTGISASSKIVYININDSATISTITSESGNWIAPLNLLRTNDLNSYYSINEKMDVVEIFVQGGEDGIASAVIHPLAASPVPPMVLGETHDYRDLVPNDTGENPEASINAPEKKEESKFDIPEDIEEVQIDEVTLENLDEGERITSEKPEFFGEAPPGTEITITVESSDPIDGKVTADDEGGWKWSPPDNLEPGTHTITLSWIDINGILNTIKKTFVVQAAEAPAFESTPSATPDSTESPAPTNLPGVSPTPIITLPPTPTATPPVSGVATHSVLLFIFGSLLLVSGSMLAFVKL